MKNIFLYIKRVSLFILLAILQFLFSGNSKHQENIYKQVSESRWSGTLTLEEKYTGITGTSERHVTVNFNNALPTLYRDDETTDLDFTDDKGTGSAIYHTEGMIGGKKVGTTDCQGTGKSELHEVSIDEESSTYRIHAVGPACTGSTVSLIDGSTTPYGPDFTDIIVFDHLGTRQDVLSGAKTETKEMPGGIGTVTQTITWHLVRATSNDIELIVTPEKYDTWLPEPGRNERTAGTIMKVSLKLRGRNGATTTKKAKSFELRLSNTSTEPGMTINFPVNSSNTSPDLRFMPQANAVFLDTTSQTMKIICHPSSQTGEFKLGSFDGGGWTVLNAEAILDDNTRVPGRLLVSNGETDIRIPKREPNSRIAEAWLKTNGNPVETDDIETSRGNSHNGDGFTAYEEYRGVITESKFKRFNPKKKELGILATQTDFTLFDEGIGWFKTGSDLEIIRFDFDREEIAPDGKLNMNAKSAHDFDQYALYLLNGGLNIGTIGKVYSKARQPDIPAQIISVVADWTTIQAAYQKRVIKTMPDLLKFTLKDYLAQTVAHELGHAVNIWHHGNSDLAYENFTVNDNSNSYRIFDRNDHLITRRPHPLDDIGNSMGTVESGDMSCMLNYYPYYKWGTTRGADGAYIFNQEPLLPLGKIFCKSKNGTGINATQLYFGDAAQGRGNCLGQIKLRN